MFVFWDLKRINYQLAKTRLGLQCQTPALSKVYFIWVGTIILGLKKFGSKRNLRLKKFLVPKKSLIRKRKQSQLLNYLTCVGKKFWTKKILVPKNLLSPKNF